MKKFFLFSVAIILCNKPAFAQSAKDAAVEIWVQTQVSPPTVTLNWVGVGSSTNYSVAKKLKTATTWSTLAATLAGSTTSYVDNNITAGTSYEYRVIRSGTSGTVNFNGYGYVNAGIQVPAIESRGRLLLMVANTFSTSLAPEIKRLETDLEGDGWDVTTLYASTTASVTQIKSQIVAAYNQDPANTKALFLFGHIPVPYSGNFNPDAHPDHQGAWPADVFYGDIDGAWTDNGVISNTVNPARIVNVIGDGKYDQNVLPSDVELQVGRLDLYGMTSFTQTETQLLKNYLDKDHDYRKKIFTAQKRGVVDDNFGYFGGEAFASNGWKNFAPLVTPTNVVANDYFTTMTGNSYLWSYGCGGGSFTSASGIGSTTSFTNSNLQGVFTILFGSYFGDWDVNNNFLRAPLCQGKTLTNLWAGRPHWALHHMALGEPIGYSTRISQNNNGIYFYAYGGAPSGNPPRHVHIALMGDPTLRNDVVAPVGTVVATKNGNNCIINWTASTQTNVLGYNIYMKNDTNKTYVKLNNSLLTGLSYTHNCLPYPGIYKYMVRAQVLENTPSGTYYNLSEGIMDTAMNTVNLTVYATAGAVYSGTSSVVNFTSTTINGTGFNWYFGDGGTSTQQNPAHTYTANGNYTATLVVTRSCNSVTVTVPVGITTSIDKLNNHNFINVYPNPSRGTFSLSLDNAFESGNLFVYDQSGKLILQEYISDKRKEISLEGASKGLYLIRLVDKDQHEYRHKVIIE